MRRILNQKFFDRNSELVAQELLGKYLVRRWRDKEISGMITEVEMYDGFRDKGSHASRGMTERNKIMFGPAGYWYPYFTYGMHWLVNISTREKGYPAAVLIRATERAYGPARTTKYFHIDKVFYGKPATRKAGLWIEDRGAVIKKSRIKKSPRVGIDYAGEYWKKKKWRYTLVIGNK